MVWSAAAGITVHIACPGLCSASGNTALGERSSPNALRFGTSRGQNNLVPRVFQGITQAWRMSHKDGQTNSYLYNFYIFYLFVYLSIYLSYNCDG